MTLFKNHIKETDRVIEVRADVLSPEAPDDALRCRDGERRALEPYVVSGDAELGPVGDDGGRTLHVDRGLRADVGEAEDGGTAVVASGRVVRQGQRQVGSCAHHLFPRKL